MTDLLGWLAVRQGLTRRIYGAADAGLFWLYLSRTPRVPLKVPVVRHVYLSDWSGPVPVLLYQAAVRASSTEGERHSSVHENFRCKTQKTEVQYR